LLALELGYIIEKQLIEVSETIHEVQRMLNGLISTLGKK